MAEQSTSKGTSKKGITPPKGRPTRARNPVVRRRRVFGSTAQWIFVAFVLTLIFVMIVVLLDGGDFNVFNSGQN
jgi:hypothetical protein